MTLLAQKILLAYSLYASLTAAGAVELSVYPNHVELVPETYHLYWNMDIATSSIQLALRVKTNGWVAFGLAEP
eukprot:CAMPEP_0197860032 /NCGR_PEP_ID=MMETSP1438-20131217/35112_1 /TAXON_ID=1461541 /ORGANISM="Pterosperma sp., Strain CCMP1384" /LENGTH=72 /DNA_ID=CAMNT_0043476737 /DNA_START=80 /DNA_END=295 /DNA_ORIENTATION=-